MPGILRGFLVALILIMGGNLRAQNETDQRPIVCFGDSYTEGSGSPRDQSYPSRLARELKLPVINAGITGQTAGEALRRFDRDVSVHNPRLVIVEFGTNEAYRGYPVEAALRNLEVIVGKLREKNIPVILVGVHFGNFQENFDAGLRDLSTRYKTDLVLNVLEGILDDPALKSDAYHPNGEGYGLMFKRILPEVRKALKREGEKAAA